MKSSLRTRWSWMLLAAAGLTLASPAASVPPEQIAMAGARLARSSSANSHAAQSAAKALLAANHVSVPSDQDIAILALAILTEARRLADADLRSQTEAMAKANAAKKTQRDEEQKAKDKSSRP